MSMMSFLRWQMFLLFASFSAHAIWAGTTRSESLVTDSEVSPSSSPQAANTYQSSEAQGATNYITIPGPLGSFCRMGGISKKAEPNEVLPLLGHFIESYGYEGFHGKSGRATEALTLFKRYFTQAKTLASLAGADSTI